MRILLICIFIMAILSMGGCNNTSDEFLSFDDIIATSTSETDYQLKENTFFSEKLVLIKDKESIGNEELINANAGLLINLTDQAALYSKNTYKKLYPANLTKLVTVLTAFRYGNLTDNVKISYNASNIPVTGAKLCEFAEDDIISLETLITCLMVYSGNDAGVAIAEHIGGSVEEFVGLMNEEATRVGAVHSNFINPHGLHDNEHYTTAYDMYLVFNELLQYSSFRNIISLRDYTADYMDKDSNIKQKTFVSSNLYHTGEKVVDGITVIGVQSGSTSKAGNCMILLSKDISDKDYIAMILKADTNSSVYSDIERLFALIPNNADEDSELSIEEESLNEDNNINNE